MTENYKAYCGDAIARLIIGEFRGEDRKITGVLSNKAMALAWSDFKGTEFKPRTVHPSIDRGYYHRTGTEFEAYLYDLFNDFGYEAAKSFVVKYLIPLQNDERLI